MKHLIIAAIVVLGLIVQPTPPTDQTQAVNHSGTTTFAGSAVPSTNSELNSAEMTSTVGGENLTGCVNYKDNAGDYHEICCLDLWIFKICLDVNLSALERIVESLI